jgi:ubiquinone/menaquinone biosynthesis C-methylase UbiE
MRSSGMNYDQTGIPAAYDRGRDHGPAVRELWMNVVEEQLEGGPHDRILDLGCGTARFSDALAVHFRASVIGLDPSMKMLAQARHKEHRGDVRFVAGAAERLPLTSGSINVIFMSMVYHHFTDAGAAARECRRVLHRGGRLVVRTGTREQMSAYPYHPFFPASHPILEEVLPPRDAIRDTFERAGLRLAAASIVQQTIATSWEEYADKLAANADSVLARLDEADFTAGIAAVRSHGARAAQQNVIEPIDVLAFR